MACLNLEEEWEEVNGTHTTSSVTDLHFASERQRKEGRNRATLIPHQPRSPSEWIRLNLTSIPKLRFLLGSLSSSRTNTLLSSPTRFRLPVSLCSWRFRGRWGLLPWLLSSPATDPFVFWLL